MSNGAYPSEKAPTFNGTDIYSAGHGHESNRRLFSPNRKELLFVDRATVDSVRRSVSTLVSHSVKLVRIRHSYSDKFSPAADDDVEQAFDKCYYQLRDFSLPFYNDSDYQERSFKEPFLHKLVLRLGNKTQLHLLLADKTSRRFVVEALVASALELWIFKVHQRKRAVVFKEATESLRRLRKMRKIQGPTVPEAFKVEKELRLRAELAGAISIRDIEPNITLLFSALEPLLGPSTQGLRERLRRELKAVFDYAFDVSLLACQTFEDAIHIENPPPERTHVDLGGDKHMEHQAVEPLDMVDIRKRWGHRAPVDYIVFPALYKKRLPLDGAPEEAATCLKKARVRCMLDPDWDA